MLVLTKYINKDFLTPTNRETTIFSIVRYKVVDIGPVFAYDTTYGLKILAK
ncbi:MAG: hypothetical protein UX72_C0006G0043 [Parcubacteria group bacterium GW2011_GWA2_47_10]|nr:MAG: hypothetical protein UX72_C0006G0043 [Parcubacteria group bacterium GW2011_GWA2_47_10]